MQNIKTIALICALCGNLMFVGMGLWIWGKRKWKMRKVVGTVLDVERKGMPAGRVVVSGRSGGGGSSNNSGTGYVSLLLSSQGKTGSHLPLPVSPPSPLLSLF